MDFMLYTMAVGQLRAYFQFSDATAGLLGTVTLVMSGVGGTIFGYVADRFGRTRALMATILIFSVASLGAATSQSVMQLLFWRAVLGIGMGGEWASGAVLVSETWPAALRNKAISIMQSGWALGYMMASIVRGASFSASPALGAEAWRWLFVVGVVPALFTLWIRRYVREPETWTPTRRRRRAAANPFAVIFGPGLLGRTLLIIALGSAVQFANWGLFFWLPHVPRAAGRAGRRRHGRRRVAAVDHSGAARRLLRLPDVRLHRRSHRTTAGVRRCTCLAAAVLVPIYGQMARSPFVLLVLGPLHRLLRLRLLQHVRRLRRRALSGRRARDGTGHQLQHRPHGGRGRAVHDRRDRDACPGVGIGLALSVTSAFFLLAAALVFTLPDRSGEDWTQRASSSSAIVWEVQLIPPAGRSDLTLEISKRRSTMPQHGFASSSHATANTVTWQMWVPCIGMALCSWLSFVDRQVLQHPVADDHQGHGTHAADFTNATSFFFLTYTLGNPVWGSVIDRVGLRIGMLLAVGVWTAREHVARVDGQLRRVRAGARRARHWRRRHVPGRPADGRRNVARQHARTRDRALVQRRHDRRGHDAAAARPAGDRVRVEDRVHGHRRPRRAVAGALGQHRAAAVPARSSAHDVEDGVAEPARAPRLGADVQLRVARQFRPGRC